MTFCDAPHRHDCQTSSTESKTGTLVATQNEQGRTSYLLDQARPIASRLFIHGIEDRNLGCESELTSRDFCRQEPAEPDDANPRLLLKRAGQESFAMHHIATAAKRHHGARPGATHCLQARIEKKPWMHHCDWQTSTESKTELCLHLQNEQGRTIVSAANHCLRAAKARSWL